VELVCSELLHLTSELVSDVEDVEHGNSQDVGEGILSVMRLTLTWINGNWVIKLKSRRREYSSNKVI
jgi:hypothetical protein